MLLSSLYLAVLWLPSSSLLKALSSSECSSQTSEVKQDFSQLHLIIVLDGIQFDCQSGLH